MVYLVPLIALLVLVPTSQAGGPSSFTPISYWNLYEAGFDSLQHKFENQVTNDFDLAPSDSTVTLAGLVGCASTSLTANTWWLGVDLMTSVGPLTNFAVSFWVYFDSTISTTVFQFGDPAGAHYVVSSTTNKKLDFTFYKDTTTSDSNNNFSTTVPLNQWFGIVFYFVRGPPVTMKVAMANFETLSQTSVQSSTAPFAVPSPIIQFGKSITGKFYQLWVSDSFSQPVPQNIYLEDIGGQNQAFTDTCDSDTCSDAACLKSGGCISAMDKCQMCAATTCNDCVTASRDPANWCQTCADDHTFKKGHCCADTNNCDQCDETGNFCTVCPADYYLYDDGSTSTTCVGKMYLACVESCDYCTTTNCFLCAEAIALDDTTCRVDSVGYTAKYVSPDIVLKFASKLTYGLALKSITATSNSGASIITTGWSLDGCIKGAGQCKIKVPGFVESDLPIDMEFEFDQTS